jgi:Fe-S oxidoreductase
LWKAAALFRYNGGFPTEPKPSSIMNDFPVRPAFWNVPLWGEIGVYLFGIAAVALLVWSIVKNVRLWRAGAASAPVPAAERGRRLREALSAAFLQKKIRETPAGRRHLILFWGFVLLFMGTALATLDWDIGHYVFGGQFLRGGVYLAYKLVLDVAGVAVLAMLAAGALRRWKKGSTLPGGRRFACAYASLAFIVLTGFLIEGLRLAATQPAWAAWSPVGSLIALAFLKAGMTPGAIEATHTVFWVIHGLSALAFIAALPLTYYAHIYRTGTNLYARERKAPGRLERIPDIEEQEHFGIAEFSQFTQAQRRAFDACTECGRCNDHCPAVRAGTPLKPRELIVHLRDRMHLEESNPEGKALPKLSDVVTRDELWSCTTCGACERACPAGISLPAMIVEMRRHLALEEGAFPEGVTAAVQNVADVGNPWGLDPYDRTKWAEGLDVPAAEPGKHYDVLYWVGCAASYDRRAMKVARAMVKILKAAKVNFAVMAEERCHGEFARRMGEEYLFETAAAENIGNFSQYDFGTILTACPHCFNTLKNEYPDFEGFAWPVVSHTEFIEKLIKDGRIALSAEAKAHAASAVYHDPCYLARLNGVTEAPRNVLKAAGAELREAAEHGADALCCGAGGGQMWAERRGKGKAVNTIRLHDLRATGASCVAVACPHCLTMLESARALEKDAAGLPISDIAEIVAAELEAPAAAGESAA